MEHIYYIVRVHDIGEIYNYEFSGSFKQQYAENQRWRSVGHETKIANAIRRKFEAIEKNVCLNRFDVEVVYNPLYRTAVDEKIASAVAIGILSAINSRPLNPKTVLALRIGDNGTIVKEEAADREINAAFVNGLDTVISFGSPKQNTQKENAQRVLYFNDLTSMLNSIFMNDEAYFREKELTNLEQALYDMLVTNSVLVSDRKRLIALLNDYFPQHPLQLNLLKLLVQMGLLDTLDNVDALDPFIQNRYSLRLQKDFAITPDEADAATRAWCLCYGKYFRHKHN